MRHLHVGIVAACLAALGLGLNAGTAAQQPRPGQTEKRDMELVGYNDLQARSAYQPVIRRQGDRWIAYIGHHGGVALNPLTGQQEGNGTSIVDVTNPKQPKYLAHIPGESGGGESGGAQMVRVCDGSQLPRADKSKVYLLRTFGNHGHEIWDVTDPSTPTRLTVVVSGLRATHKNWWECDTGIAYLVSGPPGWRTDRMTQIYDLSDPVTPVFVRDFGLPGQQPGGVGPPPTGLHGAISRPWPVGSKRWATERSTWLTVALRPRPTMPSGSTRPARARHRHERRGLRRSQAPAVRSRRRLVTTREHPPQSSSRPG